MSLKRRERKQMYAVRVPVSVLQQIREVSERHGVTRSDVVVYALEALVRDDGAALETLRNYFRLNVISQK